MAASARRAAEELARMRDELRKEMAETKTVLAVLEAVAGVDVSRETLKTSGIGKTVAKLAKDDREEVRAKAKPILEKWKKLAKLQKSASGASLPVDTEGEDASKKSASPVATSSSSLEEAGDDSSKEAARPSGPGLAPLSPPTDSKRKKTADLLVKVMKDDEEKYGADKVRLAANHVESAMCEAFGASTDEYKGMYRTLKANMGRYPELRHDVIEGRLAAGDLVRMSPDDMLPTKEKEEQKKELDEVFQASQQDWLDRNREEIMKAAGIDMSAGLYTCSRCNSKKTNHYQKQTRSADEPMTVFVNCLNCGKRWRC